MSFSPRSTMAAISLTLTMLTPVPASAAPPDDAYVAGYAAAVLEREFNLPAPSLRVRGGALTVAESDLAGADRALVVTTLSRIPGVNQVEVLTAPALAPSSSAGTRGSVRGDVPEGIPASDEARPRTTPEYQIGWLPGGILFKPLIADPRWPHFSAAYQYYIDNRQLENVAAVSFGETFTFYRNRFQDVLWEFGIQASVFSLFNLDAHSKDLINADYMAAAVAAFRWKDVSALGRVYHQSSHLGDEFLLHNSVQRINLTYEGADLRLSYEFWPGLRIYGGGGGIFDQEPSDLKPWYAEGGIEFRSPWPAGARVRPVAGVDVQTRQQNDWSADLSARAGVEFLGLLYGRNVQLLLEYFSGHSPNGQFYKDKIDYIGLGVHLHFN
jgi:Protein of unknown function (DUF1207)